ncbi:MAG: peptidase [Cytophagaceae bacterium]|nr:peptidase [Cytophagaceae bacterium]|tara:strand:- start:4719 stop:6050 length:1332 start_codon:yes stop_codon:yes gene_type:complete
MKHRLLLLLFFPIALSAQDFNKEKLDSFFKSLGDNNKLMTGFSIRQDGVEVYQNSIGFADVKQQLKANENTKYRIGSITKTFTATIILQLVDDHLLNLEDKLSKYFPQVPNAGNISLTQMLHHQSGLFNITNDKQLEKWITKPQSRKKMLERFAEHPSLFDPGTKTEYSNTNYILLSYIAEEVSGKSYSNLLQEKIIVPLGLTNTAYGKDIKPENNEALPYILHKGKWQQPKVISDMSVPMGAGGIVSSPSDLTKFYTSLFTGKLVSEESLKTMTDTSTGMGMGLGSGAFSNIKGFGHDGAIDAFHSFALYMPSKKASIAITANAVNIELMYVLQTATSIYFNEDVDLPQFKPTKPFLQLSNEDLEKYDGVYSNADFPLKITITHKNGQLSAQATGQGPFALEAIEKDIFKSFEEMITLTFNVDDHTMTLHQLGFQDHLLKKE